MTIVQDLWKSWRCPGPADRLCRFDGRFDGTASRLPHLEKRHDDRPAESSAGTRRADRKREPGDVRIRDSRNRRKAVSYTHLDVYKRQGVLRGIPLGRGAESAAQSRHRMRPARNGRLLTGTAMHREGAVSYTHLALYEVGGRRSHVVAQVVEAVFVVRAESEIGRAHV